MTRSTPQSAFPAPPNGPPTEAPAPWRPVWRGDVLENMPLIEQKATLVRVARQLNPGQFILLAIWLAFVHLTEVVALHPVYSYGVALAYLILIGVRSWALRTVQRMPESRFHVAQWLMGLPFLGTSAILGVAIALAMKMEFDASARYLLLAVLAGQHNVVCVTIGPLLRVARLYPIFLIGPIVATILFTPQPDHLAVMGILLLMSVHGHATSRRIFLDYWTGVQIRLTLEERTRELQHETLTDALTRIPNRRAFDHACERLIESMSPRDRRVSVLMLDIDHFKRINDEHGHPFGDRCIVRVARTVVGTLAEVGCTTCRFGGEEFAVLIAGCEPIEAERLARQVHGAVRRIGLENRGEAVRLTCSIGVASGEPGSTQALTELIEAADQAMYDAKTTGRDRVCLADDLAPRCVLAQHAGADPTAPTAAPSTPPLTAPLTAPASAATGSRSYSATADAL